MEIIALNSSHRAELQKLARTTFSETFSEHNSPENMQKYLDQKFSDSQLISELNCQESQFFGAYIQQQLVGYLKLNTGKAQTEAQDTDALEIERIYVLKAFHGAKVGQVLLQKAFEQALGKKYLWLGVWEKNFRALRFYEKNGFRIFDQHVFVLGNEAQTDYLMRKEV